MGCSVATIAAVTLLACRAPFAWSRLWAEDGSVFLQQAIDRGVARSFTVGYAGYYDFVPRVIGAAASAAPIHAAAFTTWIGVAVVVGWCAATIYLESETWLTTFPSRAVLALSVALLPALALESIANSANLQYTLLFTSLVALLGTSTGRSRSINRAVIVAATALSTPLTLVLAPLAGLRIIRSRPRRVDATVGAWAIATGVQLAMIMFGHPARNIASSANRDLIGQYGRSVVSANLLPPHLSTGALAPWVTLISAALVLLGARTAVRRAQGVRALLLLLVPATGFVYWVLAGTDYALEDRYRVFPALCVVWAVLVASEELLRSPTTPFTLDWRRASVVACVLALSWSTHWTPTRYRASGPSWSTSLAIARYTCQRQATPDVSIRISPVAPGTRRWTVRLRCVLISRDTRPRSASHQRRASR
jgi:hypothetical protein